MLDHLYTRVRHWLTLTGNHPDTGDRCKRADQHVSHADIERASDLVAHEVTQARRTFQVQWHENRDLEGSIAALTTWHGMRTAHTILKRAAPPATPIFQVDSLVLQDCYRALFDDPETESLVYLTGITLDDTHRTLNRCLELTHARQSRTRAAADQDASFAALLELERTDHRLQGHCHNQPGSGIASTVPSSTDRDFQHRLEANGHEAIGVIMTADGYVRFFSNDLPFTIEVHGNVTQTDADTTVFRLDDHDCTATTTVSDA